jgi:cytidine kinase
MTVRVVTIGELTVDDLIYESDACHWAQPGGGALYSAIGARIWGADVVVNSAVGTDYPPPALDLIDASGISMAGVGHVDGHGLGLWLLYEKGGRRHQVEKASGASFEQLDTTRPDLAVVGKVDGVHIAPQTTGGQSRAQREAANLHVPVTQDLLVEPFIDTGPFESGEVIAGTHSFLPSRQEVRQIWGDISPTDLRQLLVQRSGIQVLVIKSGPDGAYVFHRSGVAHVPAYCDEPIDPTGAGDAFCGGYLVGLVETGDPVEAAIRGAVSSSFIVETRNAAEAMRSIDSRAAGRRADELRKQVEDVT